MGTLGAATSNKEKHSAGHSDTEKPAQSSRALAGTAHHMVFVVAAALAATTAVHSQEQPSHE